MKKFTYLYMLVAVSTVQYLHALDEKSNKDDNHLLEAIDMSKVSSKLKIKEIVARSPNSGITNLPNDVMQRANINKEGAGLGSQVMEAGTTKIELGSSSNLGINMYQHIHLRFDNDSDKLVLRSASNSLHQALKPRVREVKNKARSRSRNKHYHKHVGGYTLITLLFSGLGYLTMAYFN